MRQVTLGIVLTFVVSFLSATASAQAPDRQPERRSFDYGGAPEFDKPPLARNDQEKQALATLDEMSQGKLEKVLPLVRPGGLILGHDMHRPMPDPRYLEAITTDPDLDTSFIMMESYGISMTVKKR